ADGLTGFISGDVHIFPVRRAEMVDKVMDMYAAPDTDSQVLATLTRGSQFHILDKTVDKNNTAWVLVRLADGREGCLPGKVRIRELPEDSIAAGKKQMLYGCLLAGAATVLLYLTRGSQGSMNVLLYVVVALGFFQFFQGLFEYNKARKNQPPTNP
ncbi:MAG TPA: SH3 domain-containing protein, partial [Anaerolineaceae bacterium]|nr:SH3 domain-containing protein [Anaerolineaceae bacterium]